MPQRPHNESTVDQLSLDDWASVLDGDASERAAAKLPTSAAAESHSESHVVAETASPPSLLTTREAAQFLRVHPRTIQRLVERGELGVVHIGSAARFDPLDLEALTGRLKHYARSPAASPSDSMRPRRVDVSFADRLRSKKHEHRAAQA